MKTIFFLILLVGISDQELSENIDSLETALKNEIDPQKQVDIINLLSYELRTFDRVKSLEYALDGLDLAKEARYSDGLGTSLFTYATLLMDVGSYDSALIFFDQSLPLLIEKSDSKDLENLHNNIGITYKRLGHLDSAIIHYEKALEFVSDQYGRGRLLVNIGSNYISLGQLDSAIINQLKAVRIFEELNIPKALTVAFLNLGNIHYKKEDFDWALKYYDKSLKNAIIAKHKPVESRNYLNIGSIHALRDNNDSAVYYFRKAIPLQEKMNDKTGLASTYRNIGEMFMQLRILDSAETYFSKSYAIYQQTDHREGKVRINKFLANLYLVKKQFDRAKSHANKSIELARESESTHELEKILEIQHQILVEQGDYKTAYSILLEQKIIGDSLFKETNISQINELQTQYETEKKDQEIDNLSQQSKIQALEISQRNTLLITGGIFLIVLILGGYFFQKQRQLSHLQAVKDMEQRMLRLQMNPHFIFNALASIQNYILQSDTKESVSYLAKFGKLMRQILEHSREEFIPIAEEVDMLHNYLQIQQLRFKNRFEYQINVSEVIDSDQTKIPPLFAQPFVENAIEHGLKDKTHGGLITVNFELHDKQITLEIKDNGSGIQVPTGSKTGHKSLATQITKERLLLLSERFKTNFSMDINQNSQSSGVVTRLVLPTIA